MADKPLTTSIRNETVAVKVFIGKREQNLEGCCWQRIEYRFGIYDSIINISMNDCTAGEHKITKLFECHRENQQLKIRDLSFWSGLSG